MAHAVKWGIISTAHINRLVIPGAHASPKVDLVAVASRDQARADEYAKKWEIERAYASYDALLADPEMRDAARMALERTPGSASLHALRRALSSAPAEFRPNLEQSLHNRRLTAQIVGTEPARGLP